MIEDMLRFLLSEYCKGKDFRLSEHAEAVIKGILKKEGHCPCKLVKTPCPCADHLKELEEKGHCHCGLFVKVK